MSKQTGSNSLPREGGAVAVVVAVVGGGPAGLAAAIQLAQKGVACTVYESRSREMVMLEDPGAAFDLRGRSYAIAMRRRGLELLERLGASLPKKLEDKSISQPKTYFWRSPSDPPTPLPPEEKCIYTTRDSLITVLLAELETKWADLVTIRFDSRLESVTQQDKEGDYVLHFTDQTKVCAQVVFGCDGINSRVRAFLQSQGDIKMEEFTDPSATKFFLIPPHPTFDRSMHVFVQRGKGNCLVLPFKDGTSSGLFLPAPSLTDVSPSLFHTITPDPSIEEVQGVRTFFTTYFPQIASAMPASDEAYREMLVCQPFAAKTVLCQDISYGRLIVLGDAAHATMPTTGQGVTASLRDAEVLMGMWDGSLASCATAFAEFSREERGNRAALFKAGSWVASNRWSYKYIVFQIASKYALKIALKYPSLMAKPLYASFNDPNTNYAQAWKDFCGHAIKLKVLSIVSCVLLLFGVVVPLVKAMANSGLSLNFGVACLCLSFGLKSPYHVFSLGKHLSLLAQLALLFPTLACFSWPWIYAVTMVVYTIRLMLFTQFRDTNKTFQEKVEERNSSVNKIPNKVRVLMVFGFALLYTIYTSPLFSAAEALATTTAVLPRPGVALAWCVMVAGVILQTLGDATKQRHKASGATTPCKAGVYALCRHPNYLGEILVWWAWAVGLSFLSGCFTGASLCFLVKTITMYGAVRKLEETQLAKYKGDAYWETVPVLFPFVPLYTLQKKDQKNKNKDE
eukprot:gb/GEZN01002356.1/.p1 GENE.gb/GEZN01002356.1/~~gb/GEZN01002356.1/.p1  ORF type:complete len:752 (+),score=101.50 gb/GEZN01002356.1/:40-2256(+)